MKKSYFLTKLLTVAGLISVGSLLACAVGPDFVKPDKPHAAGYMTGQTAESIDPIEKDNETSQHYVFGKDIPAEWWSLYHAEALDTLVREALRANPDLEAAQAALREAHENTASGEGAYYPSVEANFSPSRQKQSNISSSNLNSGSYVYNTFAAGLNVSFVPDVFGGTRRQVEVLEAQENQQRFQLEATFLTLTSNVVIGAIQEASLRAQITATEDIIHTEQDQLDILIHQEELGEAGEKDVLAQESLLAQAELTLPGLQKQLEQQRDLLIDGCLMKILNKNLS